MIYLIYNKGDLDDLIDIIDLTKNEKIIFESKNKDYKLVPQKKDELILNPFEFFD